MPRAPPSRSQLICECSSGSLLLVIEAEGNSPRNYRSHRFPRWAVVCFPCLALCFLCTVLPHPVTAIFVVVLISAPFCPTNSVGIDSFVLQRSLFATRAE